MANSVSYDRHTILECVTENLDVSENIRPVIQKI